MLELNATAHILAYEWPVHQIGPGFIPTQRPEAPTFLAAFQNAAADCEFMSLTPLAACCWKTLTRHGTCSLADHVAFSHSNTTHFPRKAFSMTP